MLRVLFTGGGGAGNEAIWRLLGDRYELHFGDADKHAFDPSIDPARCHTIPMASSPNFVDEIESLLRRLAVDVLVPGVDEELTPLALNTARLSPTKILLPPTHYVETMLDKLTSMQHLAAAGIAVPRTLPLDMVGDMTFPCILKPRRGRGSRGVCTVYSRAEAAAAIGVRPQADFVLQELLTGEEFTVLVAADAEGTLATVVPVRVGLKRGITLRARTEAEPTVIAACEAIHHAVPASACYNVQLMLTPSGRALPFEINPRISTTFCLSVAAGVDPIAVFLGQAGGQSRLGFQAGVELRRHWRNYFFPNV